MNSTSATSATNNIVHTTDSETHFAQLGLHAALLKAISEAGYLAPTPVQQQAIPAVLNHQDVLVSSQTGSGKTAAFMLPALHKLLSLTQSDSPLNQVLPQGEQKRTTNQERQSAKARGERFTRTAFQAARPKMLVLTPTRELAMQVTKASEDFCKHSRRIRTISILGGMPYPKQLQLLAKNPEILVATPGRLIDHMDAKKIDFSELSMLVLDEADRMLDMGFIEDIEKIVAKTPESRQTMLFSATLDGVVGSMARRITREPITIQITNSQTKHDNITQMVHFADDLSHKNKLLDRILRDETLNQAVVFTATKRDADHIADRLNIAGFAAAALHGDMHQGARNRTLESLRRNQVRVLVATDVAARGIDVPGITHVVNYDLPKFAEDYVHRIGRTGRAGKKGTAISLVGMDDHAHIKKIERFTKQLIPIEVIEGLEPKKTIKTNQRARPQTTSPRKASGWKPGDKRKAGNAFGRNDKAEYAPRSARASDSRVGGSGGNDGGNNGYNSKTHAHKDKPSGQRGFAKPYSKSSQNGASKSTSARRTFN